MSVFSCKMSVSVLKDSATKVSCLSSTRALTLAMRREPKCFRSVLNLRLVLAIHQK